MQRPRHCPHCGTSTPHVQPAVDHSRHRQLTVITLGVWLIVWLIAALQSALTPPLCEECDRPNRKALTREAFRGGAIMLALLGMAILVWVFSRRGY